MRRVWLRTVFLAVAGLGLAAGTLLAATPALAEPNPGSAEHAAEAAAEDDWADDDWANDDWGDDPESADVDSGFDFSGLPVEIHGFVEAAVGSRVVADDAQPDDFVLGEARMQLDLSHARPRGGGELRLDVVGDSVTGDIDFDLREALVFVRITDWMEAQAGRQILTWGTGDFVFLNDLFPKDFVSFFNGRADEYLKAPANALKLGFFHDVANLDLVWIPIFEPDRVITGERLSFFNPITGGIQGSSTPFETVDPPREFRKGELAARLYRNIRGIEVALYGYYGFSPQPTAFDAGAMRPTYARLAVYGASVRGSLLGGVAHAEFAWHDSANDRDGDDPTLPNSQLRALAGYEREVIAKLNLGGQYYLEYTLDHDALIKASSAPQFEPEKARHVVTTRVTYLALNDDLTLSLFAFVSPSDVDAYLRPSIGYKLSDELRWDVGANVLLGRDRHTFFGQLEDNTNVFTRARYAF